MILLYVYIADGCSQQTHMPILSLLSTWPSRTRPCSANRPELGQAGWATAPPPQI